MAARVFGTFTDALIDDAEVSPNTTWSSWKISNTLSARNFLHNPGFLNPVNQYGTSGQINTTGYFIDRWILVSGTVIITPNGLVLNGIIEQRLENRLGSGMLASVEMDSGEAIATYEDDAMPFARFRIASDGGTVRRAKLEMNTFSTILRDSPLTDHADELPRCQRFYYIVRNRPSHVGVFSLGVVPTVTSLTVLFRIPDNMRTMPTFRVSSLGHFAVTFTGGATQFAVAAMSQFANHTTKTFGLHVHFSGTASPGQAGSLLATNTNAWTAFDANL